MAKNLSRREEQRGWRKLYLWTIPLALVLGTALLFAPSMMNWMTSQEQRGMDEIATREPPAAGKQALGRATLGVKSNAKYREYLTDGSGRPLYLFKADIRAICSRLIYAAAKGSRLKATVTTIARSLGHRC